ncbi:DUF4625 domain-containing protein [Terrimonas pollutisoli]|uniref:DUF4625 domain-containing protein n=1 Tax=Terrimonas pollutisoli TaxID=3034147 RepID=UPI0023EC75A2|nr:DUF4625 domain-containing protein [Terrimonas sp. H1YJ31]
MKYSLLISVLSVLFLSCSKDEAEDTDAPSITISSPTNNTVLPAGEVHIKGTIADNAYINQVHVEVYDGGGTEVVHVHIHPATKNYAFDQTFTAQAGKSYKIKVIAEDPSTNSSTRQIDITCN